MIRKKIVLGFSLFLVSGVLQAQEEMPEFHESPLQTNSVFPTINTQSPTTEIKERVKFNAEILIWNTTEESLAYGVAVTPPASPTGQQLTASSDSQVAYLKPGMGVGTRIACIVPFTLPSHSWETALTWTYYINHQSTSISLPATPDVSVIRDRNHLTPIFTNFTHIPMAQGANVYWGLTLNALDLEVVKYFSPLSSLSIRAHGGIRGAWIWQTFNIRYTGVTINSFITPFEDILSKNSIRFSGWGLCLGLDNAWKLGSGFKMFANVAISILDSVFNNVQNQSSASGLKEVFLSTKIYDISQILDLLAGFGWEKEWKNNWAISVYLLWEENLWFHQNQFSYFTTQNVPGHQIYFTGNLGFSGPVVGVNLVF